LRLLVKVAFFVEIHLEGGLHEIMIRPEVSRAWVES
jgi:hypothetical protein